MLKRTFLVEIGTEELPPKSLRNLGESFASNFTTELIKAGLIHENVKWFATPRRLALKVVNLAISQPNQEIEKRGPSVIKAFDAKGNPNKVAKSWAHSCGITIDQAERLITDKGEWLLYRSYVKGKSAEKLLPKIVETALSKLPVLKLMRWGVSNTQFIRPIHTVTLLLGDRIIQSTIFGIKSNQLIFGHRFIGDSKFNISNADQYPQILLERSKVLADYEQRKAKIKNDIEEIVHKIKGNIQLSDNLLEEVTSLVEWPVVLMGKFEEKFLSIPEEVLVFSMKRNQKCFPVYGNNGKLLPKFIFVTNIESKDPKQVISGNEMVMHARLVDAEFFFNTDRKKRLEDYLPLLEKSIFQEKLGTLRDKTERIQALSGWIARKIGANVNYVIRTGLLAKCDLMTNMVFEFTEAQGIIGMHYARSDGELEEIAIALGEQYHPRFSGDRLPSSLVSCSVAIADKIDTLVGIFGIGQQPKGKRDPFALRRTALGVLRIMIEKSLDLDLEILIEEATYLYNNKLTNFNVKNEVIDFMLNRFRSWYQEEGYSISAIQAVLVCRPTRPKDFDSRVKAVSYFHMQKEAKSLITINKRISNILAKSDETLNNIVYPFLLSKKAEIKLAENLVILREKLQIYFSEGRYQEALMQLFSLQEDVDTFFKTVIINDKNKDVRINRLTLLDNLRKLFLNIADFSLLN